MKSYHSYCVLPTETFGHFSHKIHYFKLYIYCLASMFLTKLKFNKVLNRSKKSYLFCIIYFWYAICLALRYLRIISYLFILIHFCH